MAGTVSSPIKCTPKDSPIRNAIITSQRSPRGVCITASHLRPSQNITEVINMAMAYTSASTALNQNESENA